jgi:hypothetical protein
MHNIMIDELAYFGGIQMLPSSYVALGEYKSTLLNPITSTAASLCVPR